MPIHFRDLDVISEAEGLSSALIVPCNLCPAVTVAVREQKPFMQLFRSLLRSVPFERYIRALKTRLGENGTKTDVFRSYLYHQWFLCMWTSSRRAKLRKRASKYEAVVVLGCESATETVRDAVEGTDCRVVEGMEVTGIMNALLRFHLPCSFFFDGCKVVPISGRRREGSIAD